MGKMYFIKDEKSEIYVQVETNKKIWEFLDKLAYRLYDENWMIDDHYQSLWKKSGINDYFSFSKDGVHLIIVMTDKRTHLIILGFPDNSEIKKFVFENYQFD